MKRLLELIEDILVELRGNNFDDIAEDLEEVKGKLESSDSADKAEHLKALVQRSNIRWYGDLNMKIIVAKDWTELRNSLAKCAKKELKELEY